MSKRSQICSTSTRAECSAKERCGAHSDDGGSSSSSSGREHSSSSTGSEGNSCVAGRGSLSRHRGHSEAAVLEGASRHRGVSEVAVPEGVSTHRGMSEAGMLESVSRHRGLSEAAVLESVSRSRGVPEVTMPEGVSRHRGMSEAGMLESVSRHRGVSETAMLEGVSRQQRAASLHRCTGRIDVSDTGYYPVEQEYRQRHRSRCFAAMPDLCKSGNYDTSMYCYDHLGCHRHSPLSSYRPADSLSPHSLSYCLSKPPVYPATAAAARTHGSHRPNIDDVWYADRIPSAPLSSELPFGGRSCSETVAIRREPANRRHHRKRRSRSRDPSLGPVWARPPAPGACSCGAVGEVGVERRRAVSVDCALTGSASGMSAREWDSWLSRCRTSGRSSLEYDERLQKLEADKSSLQSQVSVLTELIDSQTEKIAELQHQVHTRQMLLGKAEDRLQKDLALQQELLQRSSFETQKLELMNKLSSLTLQQRTLEKENMELRSRLRQAETFISSRQLTSPGRGKRDKPPLAPRPVPAAPIQHSSSPCDTTPSSNAVTPSGENGVNGVESDDSEVCPPDHNNHITPLTSRLRKHSSLPNSPPVAECRRIVSLGGTLPRGHIQPNSTDILRTGTCNSVPSGTGADSVLAGDGEISSVNSSDKRPTESTPFSPFTKQKSLRRLFGKIKRSGSGGLDSNGASVNNGGEFKRGGIRATAGARLNFSLEKVNACSSPLSNDSRSMRFCDWSTAMLVSWFNEMGLSAYTEQLRYGAFTGSQLVSWGAAELEKQLHMKHPMHVKKVLLAVGAASCTEGGADLPGHLDHNFVLRWLDDVGLPLYREAFLEARVDGRVLDRLTLLDLQTLRVNNLVHALSLKRGIQVLRQGGFSVGCLRRRSTAEEQRPPPPSDVALWTNHRAMEWLKEIDLAEYAPNMRGSGVHGALFIYEPRFTGELLASVLAIPTSKSLLRRHLFTKFNELIGPEVLKQKRSVEEDQTVTPLRIDAKIKFHKRGQLTLRRRKTRCSDDTDELLCPQDAALQDTSLHENSFHDTNIQEKTPDQDISGQGMEETIKANSNGVQETAESNHTLV